MPTYRVEATSTRIATLTVEVEAESKEAATSWFWKGGIQKANVSDEETIDITIDSVTECDDEYDDEYNDEYDDEYKEAGGDDGPG